MDKNHDVVVVNFINKGNRADQRVFELLSQKFQLFEGVFGASDDILGSIESGVDIERRIHEIYQHCRSDEQIEQEFNQLQDELKDQLENRENETRRSLFEHFDVDVVRNLENPTYNHPRAVKRLPGKSVAAGGNVSERRERFSTF